MTLLYLILLGVAGFLLLVDAFSEYTRGNRLTGKAVVRLLPLALFFWLLVEFIRTAKQL
jgi:hypothetical protein